jgi:hypothetical protein
MGLLRRGWGQIEISVNGKVMAEEFWELLGSTLYVPVHRHGEELADSVETFSCMFAVVQVTITVSTHHHVTKR